jgi:hypothetical protein
MIALIELTAQSDASMQKSIDIYSNDCSQQKGLCFSHALNMGYIINLKNNNHPYNLLKKGPKIINIVKNIFHFSSYNPFRLVNVLSSF